MKVFKFYSGDFFYAYSGETEEEAKQVMLDDIGEMEIDDVEEIPESQWDEKMIKNWEDNDFETEPYMVSIREVLSDKPCMIFTNDYSTF